MEHMTRMAVVKAFFEQGTSRKVSTTEFMAFWKACSDAERDSFGRAAAAELGVELKG